MSHHCHICGCEATEDNWVGGFDVNKMTCERCRKKPQLKMPEGWTANVIKNEVHIVFEPAYHWIIPIGNTEKSELSPLEVIDLLRAYVNRSSRQLDLFLKAVMKSNE